MQSLYICIASGQTLANLIPAIMIKPNIIWVVSTETMLEKAEQLEKCIRSTLPETEIQRCDLLSDKSFEQMGDYALELEEKIQTHYPDTQVIYNVTGGNKLMSMAFSEVFWEYHICYTDTQHDSLLYLRPDYKQLPFANELDIEHYLLANGLDSRQAESDSLEWQQLVQARKPLTFWLAKHTEQLKDLFTLLNRLVSESIYQKGRDRKLSSTACNLSYQPKGVWEEALPKA